MSYSDLVSEDIRLEILRILEQDPDYAQNDRIIGAVLASVGHDVSQDKLITELHWLAEQGLLGIEVISNLTVARLTTRGADVAKGKSIVPGVRRPRPGGA